MRFTALDVETSNSDAASICQIGFSVFENGEIVNEESILINPEARFARGSVHIHGISVVDVIECPIFPDVYPFLCKALNGTVVVHHTAFDRNAMNASCDRYKLPRFSCTWLDSSLVVRKTWPEYAKKGFGLKNLSQRFGIEFRHHDALEDARTAGQILLYAIEESGISMSQWVNKLKCA